MTGAPSVQQAADQLVEALHTYLDDGPVDLIGPVDDLLSAARGTASEASLAAVLRATAAIPNRYWDHASRLPDSPQAASTMALSLFEPLRSALFAVVHPFPDQEALLTCEREVADLETAVRAAGEALEAAVAAGDVATVLSVRAEAQVTLPGKLAEARTRLMELQLRAAEGRLDAAEEYARHLSGKRDAAKAAVEKATAELASRGVALKAAETEVANGSAVASGVRAEIARIRESLVAHQADHGRQQQERIRQLAGLAVA